MPRIEIVQASQCLGLYWWAVGETERTHIHSRALRIPTSRRIRAYQSLEIAYMNARLLGLHVQADDTDARDSLLGEIRRRIFWACWINQCISQENANFEAEPWKDAIGLKFPSDDESWHAGQPNAKEMFGEKGDIVSFNGLEVVPIPSEPGERIKLIGIWYS